MVTAICGSTFCRYQHKYLHIKQRLYVAGNHDVVGEAIPPAPPPWSHDPRGLGGRDERGPGRRVDEGRSGFGENYFSLKNVASM